ncbi:MAG: histidine kinase [Spirochaetaceae bacterium]
MEIEKSKVRQLNQTIANLTDTNYGYQHYVKVVEEKSTEDERNRIIREIHDSIGYTLTTIMMISRSILDMNKGKLGIISENLEEIHSGARDGLKDMRIVLRILKIKKEEHLSHFMELRRMIKAFEKASNLKIRLEWGNTPDNFGEEASHIIFRIIQEGMVNALRHGIASEIDIFLFVGSGKLMITINDNGKGFNKKDPGLGISGMRERIKKFNGTMTLSNSKIGAKVSIELPIEKVLVYGKD